MGEILIIVRQGAYYRTVYMFIIIHNYYWSGVDVEFTVLFSRLEIYAVNKTVGHRRRTVSYIFAFCKDINASSLLFFLYTYFSITTRSHRIVSRTLLVVKTPSSTRAHKKAEVVKTHYICIYITGLVKQKKKKPSDH